MCTEDTLGVTLKNGKKLNVKFVIRHYRVVSDIIEINLKSIFLEFFHQIAGCLYLSGTVL